MSDFELITPYESLQKRFDRMVNYCDDLEEDNVRLTEAVKKEEANHIKHMRQDAQEIERLTARVAKLEADNKRLRETGKALRDDMLLRARMTSTDGDLMVEASAASKWSAFCEALETDDE